MLLVLGGCGCLVVIIAFIIIGIVFLCGLLSYGFFGSVREPANVVGEHLKEARSKNYEASYEYLSVSLKKEMPFSNFVGHIKANLSIYDSKSHTFGEVKIYNETSTVTGVVENKDGKKTNVMFKLVKEQGSWKISEFDFGIEDMGNELLEEARGNMPSTEIGSS